MSTQLRTDEDFKTTALDSLGAVLASARRDTKSIAVLVSACSPEELQLFAVAAVGHGGYLLRLASNASGIPVESIADGVASSIRQDVA
jgi:hypothetical protein